MTSKKEITRLMDFLKIGGSFQKKCITRTHSGYACIIETVKIVYLTIFSF
jgi:hypothetical protein